METTVEIPTILIREVINGKPYYYKGYRNVLAAPITRQSIESIMGSSEAQSTLAAIIMGYLFNQLDRKQYKIVTNEPGLHLGKRDNVANDVAIYRRTDLPNDRDTSKYFTVAPLVAIEIDIRIESMEENSNDFSYMLEKSRKLIESGTQQVVWVLNQNETTVVFSRQSDGLMGRQPQLYGWDESIGLLPGVTLNLLQWLQAEGERNT